MKKIFVCMLSLLPFVGLSAQSITLDIPSAEAFEEWTVLDVNNDKAPYAWAYNDGDALYTENKKSAANDWLISPAVTLKGGTSYKVSAYLRNASTYTSDKQKFTINAGTAPEVDALSTVLYKNESLLKSSYFSNYDGVFTPETDGEYYFAIHCYSASYNGDFLFQKFVLDELVAHPGAVTDLQAVAGPAGEMVAVVSWTWPVKTDMGGALSGELSANVYRYTSSYFPSDLSTCLVGTVSGGVAGEEGSYVDTSIPEAGKYYYRVVTFNADGVSTSTPADAAGIWVGKDTSVKPASNVVATVVDDHTVSLTFTPATEGSNGGFVESSDVTYSISRKAGSDNPVVLVNNYSGEQPYIDSDIEGLNSYVYIVTTIYQGNSLFTTAQSNAVVLGGAVTIPYSQDFSSDNHFFSFFHGEGATRDWSVSSKQLNYWGAPANAYAASPAIKLASGKAYELTFSTRINNSSTASYKDLYVMIGKSATVDGLDTQLFFETIKSTISSTKTVNFSVPESGDYYIAFLCRCESNYNDIYVDDIKIVEIVVVPQPVEDLAATVGAEGEMSVKLTWTNPSEDNAGGALAAIDRVVVSRNGSAIATLENCEPGQAEEYTDSELAEPGKYTYSVTVYVGDKSSDAVTVESSWVGEDTPDSVSSVTASYNEDDNTVTITWEAVASTGINGGYVDASAMSYKVVRMPDEVEVANHIAGLTCADADIDLPLGKYYYNVYVEGYEDVAPASSEKILLGDVVPLSYEPDYTDPSTFDVWTMLAAEGSGTWKHNSKDNTFEASFTSNNPWAFTPPFYAYQGKYKLVYQATCYNARYTEDIEVVLTKTPSVNIDDMIILDERKIETVSWPSDIDINFTIAEEGKYYIGFHCATEDSWKLALHKSNIYVTQITGVEEVDVEGGLTYDRAAATVTAAADVEVSVYASDGRVVAAGKQSVNVGGLVSGVYVARAGDAVIKFVK